MSMAPTSTHCNEQASKQSSTNRQSVKHKRKQQQTCWESYTPYPLHKTSIQQYYRKPNKTFTNYFKSHTHLLLARVRLTPGCISWTCCTVLTSGVYETHHMLPKADPAGPTYIICLRGCLRDPLRELTRCLREPSFKPLAIKTFNNTSSFALTGFSDIGHIHLRSTTSCEVVFVLLLLLVLSYV